MTADPLNLAAQVGDLVHDAGCLPNEGWFVVGKGGYWDVDNGHWVEDDPDDAPWTAEHFDLHGPLADLARAAAVERQGLGRIICDALDAHWPNSGVNGWYLADLIRAALDPAPASEMRDDEGGA